MKGVSPVVATVLMVAVAIAAAVVAYSWFMSMQASVQAEASRGAGTVGKERLAVASVYCDDSHHLHVVLRNIGDESITGEFSFYVKNAATGEVNAVYRCRQTATIPVAEQKDLDLASSTDCNAANAKSCTELPARIIVEVHAPGGSVVSAQQRIK